MSAVHGCPTSARGCRLCSVLRRQMQTRKQTRNSLGGSDKMRSRPIAVNMGLD